MTELLHYSIKDRHWTCALSLFSSKVLFGILAPALCSLCPFLPSRTQICPSIRTWMGLCKLSFPWWCTWLPRTSQTKTCLSLNPAVFHRVLETWIHWQLIDVHQRPDVQNLWTINPCNQFYCIYGSNHWANELMSCSTPSLSDGFVEGQRKMPADAFKTQIKMQLDKRTGHTTYFFSLEDSFQKQTYL